MTALDPRRLIERAIELIEEERIGLFAGHQLKGELLIEDDADQVAADAIAEMDTWLSDARAYLSLAPSDNGLDDDLIEKFASPCWTLAMASIPRDVIRQHFREFAAEVLQADRTALTSENVSLVHDNERYVKQAAELATEIERLRAERDTAREAAAFQEKNWRQERDLKLEMVDHARAAESRLSALETLLDKAAWQPIETAPKDGTKILYLSKFEDIGFCRWDEGYNEDDQPCWWDTERDDEVCPVVWLPVDVIPPLPAAPKLQEARHAGE